MQDQVDAIVIEGATPEQIAHESLKATEEGRMCIVFPSQELMNQWLQRTAALS